MMRKGSRSQFQNPEEADQDLPWIFSALVPQLMQHTLGKPGASYYRL
jgi:hypothetical protein